MSSVTARLSIIGETTSCEPDQDANSALTELDKGKSYFLYFDFFPFMYVC